MPNRLRIWARVAHARGRYPRRRVRVDEHTISLDDSPVYYRRADRSGMPTLYLHGIPTSSDDWLVFLSRCGGVAPDLIGFGRSGKGGHLDYSLSGLARFVERFLDHLAIKEVQLVGHDWGAAVAMTFASRDPSRVRGIVLCNPAPLQDEGDWPRILRLWRKPGVGELLMGSIPKWLLARTLRRGSTRSDAWPDARIAAVWDQFDQGTQRAILRLVRSAGENMVGSGGPPALDALEAAAPQTAAGPETAAAPQTAAAPDTAVVLWGEEDPWYPRAVADQYAARLTGARVEPIGGAGHWPWLDRPEVVDRVAALLEG
jgi:pimeloyl-ACP methyl ester carboxylesterase